MRVRVVLRSVHGETVTRDMIEGNWADPVGDADLVLGENLWALPGLVDGHAHFAAETMAPRPGNLEDAITRARTALDAGVLLALDKGWGDLTVLDLVDRIDPGDRPEIEAAGLIHAVEGGYIAEVCRIIDPGEVGPAMNQAAGEGRGWVKLIGDWPRKGTGPLPNFTEEQLGVAVRSASAAGARVAVHTMARDVPSMAVRAGVHSIEHGLFLQLEDLDDLGSRGGIWVPTVLNMEAVIRQLGEHSSGGRLITEGLANVARLLPEAIEAGVHILAGTDLAVGTHQVGQEAVRLAEMGLSPKHALRAVSYSGFEATGRPVAFEVDAAADAVMFDANPEEDLGVLAHPRHVIRRGRVVK